MEDKIKKFKVVIIDDEKHGRELLKKLVIMNGDDFIISGEADSVESGISVIEETEPDLVFLDIELYDRSGFEILEHFSQINFSIIFATAYNYYAIKAIKFAALDYLLKPIDQSELTQALDKVRAKVDNNGSGKSRISLAQSIMDKPKPDKIALPSDSGYIFIDINDIIRCEAESNYTKFFLKNKSEILTCHTLKEYESLLEGLDFFRIHHSHLINMKLVQSYIKGKGGNVIMKDGTQLEVSTRRKDMFLKQFAKL
ncbi:MAG: LytTR family DNA-binding domain-containing protein [Candidatus Kapabacteria bacterium]|nr:LytTR family DNA-binding domain-containing protein [Candidatus Kapabacteria bacterium]